MEDTYIVFIIGEHKSRKYFFRDKDEAKAFELLFEGDIVETHSGYTVTI